MEAFPHHYTVTAHSDAQASTVSVTSAGLTSLSTDAPAEFGGPGDQWSPETLVMAAVADCFVLSFRAISRASKVDWSSISCEATGTLDRVDRKTLFTEIGLNVSVTAPSGADREKLMRMLEKSEESCLITNSMTANVSLVTDVQIG